MIFEEFSKKLNKNIAPDDAYKIYLQAKIALIEEVLIASSQLITREEFDRIEDTVFDKLIIKMKNK